MERLPKGKEKVKNDKSLSKNPRPGRNPPESDSESQDQGKIKEKGKATRARARNSTISQQPSSSNLKFPNPNLTSGSTSLSSSLISEKSNFSTTSTSSFDILDSTLSSPRSRLVESFHSELGNENERERERTPFSSQISPQNPSSPEINERIMNEKRMGREELNLGRGLEDSLMSVDSGSGSGSGNESSNNSSNPIEGQETTFQKTSPSISRPISNTSSSPPSENDQEPISSDEASGSGSSREETDYLQVRRIDSVRSISSTGSLDQNSNSSKDDSSMKEEKKEEILSARLVTIHLHKTKEAAGIWPLLIKGGVEFEISERVFPTKEEEKGRMEEAQSSLSRALSDALKNQEDHVLEEEYGEEVDEDGMDSDYSDAGSDTVLGARPGNSRERNRSTLFGLSSFANDISNSESKEQKKVKFNCDATSLALLGQLALVNSHSNPSPQNSRNTDSHNKTVLEEESRSRSRGKEKEKEREIDEAFKFFAESWGLGGISLATRRLVEEYLPLINRDRVFELEGGIEEGISNRGRTIPNASQEPLVSDSQVTLPPNLGSEMVNQGSCDTLQPPHLSQSSLEESTTDNSRTPQMSTFPPAMASPSSSRRASPRPFIPSKSRVSAQSSRISTSLPHLPHQDTLEISKIRNTLIQYLGGNLRLAKLYLDYARLDLDCSEDLQSPLAFPSGMINNPFNAGGNERPKPSSNNHRVYSSPSRASSTTSSVRPVSNYSISIPGSPVSAQEMDFQNQVEEEIDFGPLPYLEEALKLDPTIQVSEEEWLEAKEIKQLVLEELQREEEHLLRFNDRIQEGEISPRSNTRSISISNSNSDSLPFSFDDQDEGRKRRKSKKSKSKSSRRDEKDRRRRGKRRVGQQEDEEGNEILNFVSATALISVALAGGVVALNWWRRAGGTNSL